MRKNDIKQILKDNSHIFKKYPVIAVYLFGSRLNGRVGPMSDWDFGIQLDEHFPAEKYLDIKLKILSELVEMLNSDAIDLVILNEAPLLLRYNILRDGWAVYVNKPEKKALFVFDSIARYLDWSYFGDKLAAALVKKIAKEGLNV